MPLVLCSPQKWVLEDWECGVSADAMEAVLDRVVYWVTDWVGKRITRSSESSGDGADRGTENAGIAWDIAKRKLVFSASPSREGLQCVMSQLVQAARGAL